MEYLAKGRDDIITIETKRLKIYPAAREQMEAFAAAETDAELRKAYTEMLEGCIKHPDQWEWYAMWMIDLRDGTHIGDLCFKGLGADGAVEIGYGISEEYRGKGYAAEAVDAAVNWAMKQPAVTRVEAERSRITGPLREFLKNADSCRPAPWGKKARVFIKLSTDKAGNVPYSVKICRRLSNE